jgi:hypothetical protein
VVSKPKKVLKLLIDSRASNSFWAKRSRTSPLSALHMPVPCLVRLLDAKGIGSTEVSAGTVWALADAVNIAAQTALDAPASKRGRNFRDPDNQRKDRPGIFERREALRSCRASLP